MEDCNVCCEKVNKTVRKPIQCGYCMYRVCRTCVKQYVLDSFHQPHCMNCRREWSHTFLIEHLGSFMKTEYRAKRELLLFEREKTTIPGLLPVAERERQIESINFHTEMAQKELMNWYRDYVTVDSVTEWQREKREIKRTIRQLIQERSRIYLMDTKEERKAFVMKCTVEECRGFLSTRYKCGLCSTSVCPDCHVALTPTHQCDPNVVLSIIELKKTTKPCPSCHCPIFKTEGCDQMWCIQCHTAFSWRSGQVEKGIIHNPHYFEFVKGKGGLGRNPFDIPCGGLPDYNQVYHMMAENQLGQDEVNYLRVVYEMVGQHREITMRNIPNDQEQLNHRALTLSYILQHTTEHQYKATLYVREQKRQRGLEERQMLEAFLAVIEESFRKVVQFFINFDEFLMEVEQIKAYTRREIGLLNERYQHTGFLTEHMI